MRSNICDGCHKSVWIKTGAASIYKSVGQLIKLVYIFANEFLIFESVNVCSVNFKCQLSLCGMHHFMAIAQLRQDENLIIIFRYSIRKYCYTVQFNIKLTYFLIFFIVDLNMFNQYSFHAKEYICIPCRKVKFFNSNCFTLKLCKFTETTYLTFLLRMNPEYKIENLHCTCFWK